MKNNKLKTIIDHRNREYFESLDNEQRYHCWRREAREGAITFLVMLVMILVVCVSALFAIESLNERIGNDFISEDFGRDLARYLCDYKGGEYVSVEHYDSGNVKLICSNGVHVLTRD